MKNQNSEEIHFPTTLLTLTLIKILYQDNVINKATYEVCVKKYEKDIQPEWEELELKLQAREEQYRTQKECRCGIRERMLHHKKNERRK